ncbi:hypothetical protein B0H14DRAFT_1218204 [Mycena olivaceomarginata]|nr:hypothetical protein B0H14DRAFT_1218204 [Mycena olivaceomarginata]
MLSTTIVQRTSPSSSTTGTALDEGTRVAHSVAAQYSSVASSSARASHSHLPAPLLLPRSATRLLGRAFRSPFLPPSHGTRPVPRPTVLQRRERDIATPSSVLRIRSSLRARRGAICGVMRWRDVLETRPRVRRDGLPREQADIARQAVVVAGARKGDRSCSMRRGRCLQVKVRRWRRFDVERICRPPNESRARPTHRACIIRGHPSRRVSRASPGRIHRRLPAQPRM